MRRRGTLHQAQDEEERCLQVADKAVEVGVGDSGGEQRPGPPGKAAGRHLKVARHAPRAAKGPQQKHPHVQCQQHLQWRRPPHLPILQSTQFVTQILPTRREDSDLWSDHFQETSLSKSCCDFEPTATKGVTSVVRMEHMAITMVEAIMCG